MFNTGEALPAATSNNVTELAQFDSHTTAHSTTRTHSHAQTSANKERQESETSLVWFTHNQTVAGALKYS